MRLRDLVVLGVLGVTLVVGVAVWWPIGRWASLVVLLAGLLVASAVYRMRPSAVRMHEEEPAPEQDERVSTPRPASARRGPSSRG